MLKVTITRDEIGYHATLTEELADAYGASETDAVNKLRDIDSRANDADVVEA